MPAAQLERYGKDRAQIPSGIRVSCGEYGGRYLRWRIGRWPAMTKTTTSSPTANGSAALPSLWNFGGVPACRQLIAAMQQRCGFQPGEVRWCCSTRSPSISKPVPVGRRGDREFGRKCQVADMVNQQPWDDDVPVRINAGLAARQLAARTSRAAATMLLPATRSPRRHC